MIKNLLHSIKAEENCHLARYTTFKIGGPAKVLIHCQTPAELESAVSELVSGNFPFILIGGGSNLVVSDKGLDCHVIRYVSNIPHIRLDDHDMVVTGSSNLDSVVEYAAESGLEGLNYASGIPGTIGGAIVGNAGAFGQQVSDALIEVDLIDKRGNKRTVPKKDIQFSYRYSSLKETGEMVLGARFSLMLENRDVLLKERQEFLSLRKEKHPDLENEPCAGSFFRNIEPTSSAEKRQATGWFLEQAGAKVFQCGGASIYSKHANIIVNSNEATAKEIYELSKKMASIVKQKYDIDLIREVHFVGKIDGVTKSNSALIW